MRYVFVSGIRTALFAGLLLGGLAVAGAQQPSDQSAPPQSAPQTDQQAPQTASPGDQQTAPQAEQPPAAQPSAPRTDQQAPQTPPPADQQPAPQTAAPADNTKVNVRDRSATEPTADRQKDNRSDREITQQVRKAIVKDKSLSMYAHNVKVITQNGMVTLKGPVRSEEEKKAIEAKAAEVAGQDKVTNQLDVKSKD
jgi:hyperosmotically inducible periplasmic protein